MGRVCTRAPQDISFIPNGPSGCSFVRAQHYLFFHFMTLLHWKPRPDMPGMPYACRRNGKTRVFSGQGSFLAGHNLCRQSPIQRVRILARHAKPPVSEDDTYTGPPASCFCLLSQDCIVNKQLRHLSKPQALKPPFMKVQSDGGQ